MGDAVPRFVCALQVADAIVRVVMAVATLLFCLYHMCRLATIAVIRCTNLLLLITRATWMAYRIDRR